MNDPIVIVSALRTPMGSFQGALSSATASELGACAINGAIEKAGINPADVDEVIIGNVLPAGQGQAPARQASLGAGLPLAAGCTTINKMCGSGMKAVMLAHDLLAAGSSSVMVAGGMESMSNAPYLLPKARAGMRMGHAEILDHMFIDGLEDAYDKGKLMGVFAEACADKYRFSRAQQDDFAISSLKRAQTAIKQNKFVNEINTIKIKSKNNIDIVERDEPPFNAKIDKIPVLRPAFCEAGTVTAANASSIADGAAALVMMRASEANRLGLKPRARILGHASHAHAPAWFTTAPVGAIQKCIAKTGLSVAAIDLFEINEAFAVVPMAAMQALAIDHGKVNIHGGACALGHPIGASGARIMVTLLAALESCDHTIGMAALCIGGGEATAIAIERI